MGKVQQEELGEEETTLAPQNNQSMPGDQVADGDTATSNQQSAAAPKVNMAA